MDLDVSYLLEDQLAFVGISSAMLESPLLRKLPSKGVVLVVCPDQDQLDDNLLHCRELRGLGYQLRSMILRRNRVWSNLSRSYKLLRYINAPVNGFHSKRSIAHALAILGYKQLYRWLTLLLLTSGETDPRSRALLQQNALVRARMTELLGQGKLPLARREGVYAHFLALFVACEEANPEAIIECAAACGLDANEVNTAQVKALVWSEAIDS